MQQYPDEWSNYNETKKKDPFKFNIPNKIHVLLTESERVKAIREGNEVKFTYDDTLFLNFNIKWKYVYEYRRYGCVKLKKAHYQMLKLLYL